MSEQLTEQPGTVEEQGEDSTGESPQSSLRDLGELLAADGTDSNEETPGGKDGESSGSEKKTTPTKFNDLAGATDLDLDALYKLEVQIEGVDEPVTVETLKDHFKSAQDLDLKVLAFEEERTEKVNELVRVRAELEEIMAALPANAVKPEVLERIRAKAEATNVKERKLTLDVIPEWRDDKAREADIAAMSEHLQGYGFPINYLERVISHQQLRYIRDNMLRERRVKAALAKVKPGKPDKSGNAPPQTKAASKAETVITPKAGESRLEAFLSNV